MCGAGRNTATWAGVVEEGPTGQGRAAGWGAQWAQGPPAAAAAAAAQHPHLGFPPPLGLRRGPLVPGLEGSCRGTEGLTPGRVPGEKRGS